MAMGGKFAAYAPHFQGMAKPEDAARDVLNVIDKATLEANGGQLVSHFGNKQWLWIERFKEMLGTLTSKVSCGFDYVWERSLKDRYSMFVPFYKFDMFSNH